jgi:23S rRNA (adenine2503-C2)-methyltransferase
MLEEKMNFYGKNLADLTKIFADNELKTTDANALYANIYGKKVRPITEKAKLFFAQKFTIELPLISKVLRSDDGTIKLLLELADKEKIEAVLLPFRKRYTLCLSTQVGCAMNCQFCFTGTMGLKRHLAAEEIIGQYTAAFNFLKEQNLDHKKPNIVFMGQGEPLHNAQEVERALHIFTDTGGLSLSPRQITLSTAGYLPGLNRLSSFPAINLALSLHSPFEEERSVLIPINKTYPLKEVLNVLQSRPLLKKQFIIYEYLLIKGFNHEQRHADKLQELFAGTPSIFNLIPFNPYPNAKFKRPSDDEVEEFRNFLVERKLRVMVRKTKGSEMLAACGQLRT